MFELFSNLIIISHNIIFWDQVFSLKSIVISIWPLNVAVISDKYVAFIDNKYVMAISDQYLTVISDNYVLVISDNYVLVISDKNVAIIFAKYVAVISNRRRPSKLITVGGDIFSKPTSQIENGIGLGSDSVKILFKSCFWAVSKNVSKNLWIKKMDLSAFLLTRA